MVKANKLVAGIVVGATTGTAIGLLMAPKSGRDTRKMVRGKTDQYAQAFRGRFKKDRVVEMVGD